MVSKSIKIALLGAATLAFAVQAGKYKLDFIPMKFEDFVNKFMADKNERENYKKFHVNVLEKRQKGDDKQKTAINNYLYRKGLAWLEDNHKDWHASLKPYISDPIITLSTKYNDVRVFIDTFLVRLGTLGEFTTKKLAQAKAKEPAGITDRMWSSVKTYANAVKDTMSNWLGFSRKTA